METWMILLLVSLFVSAIGFRKFVWFLSIGYAFSIAALCVALGVIFYARLTLPVIAMLAIVLAYSLRLGVFLLLREKRSGTYRKVLEEVTTEVKKVPLFVSIAVWIAVSLMYFTEIAPLYFRLSNDLVRKSPYLFLAGIIVTFIGFILQTLADLQKSRAKKINPERFCDTGLYRMVRCPNYLGEILVWTGMILGSISTLASPLQVILSVLGYVGIVFVMFNGARRLELRQESQYGGDADYRAYVSRTPILLPLIPLYSLKRWKFLG
jgi:steroid 5-alpha reductase family enzyme